MSQEYNEWYWRLYRWVRWELPYQGEQGGSNLKSIFNLIITSYLTDN